MKKTRPRRLKLSRRLSVIKAWLSLLGWATVQMIADILEMTRASVSIMLRRACERGEIKRKSQSARGIYYRYLYMLPESPRVV